MKYSVKRGWMLRTGLGVGGVMIAVLFWGGKAFPDGAFGKLARLKVQQDIRGPEQKAVIAHRGGQETLILSVKYEGAAGDFAWVVPVPSRPKVEKGDPKIFEALAWTTAPPEALTKQGASQPTERQPQVEVLERIQVGVYDVAVVAARDERALTDWLNNNGYRLPGGSESVLKHYVRKGWFYVAMRIDPKKVEEDLVRALREVDSRIDSLERAEDVAVRMAGEDVVAERTYVASRLKQVMDSLGQTLAGSTPGNWNLRHDYHTYLQRYWQEHEPIIAARSGSVADEVRGSKLAELIRARFQEADAALQKGSAEDPAVKRAKRGLLDRLRGMMGTVPGVTPGGFGSLREAEEATTEAAAEDVREGRPYLSSCLQHALRAVSEATGIQYEDADSRLRVEYEKHLILHLGRNAPQLALQYESKLKTAAQAKSHLRDDIARAFREARDYISTSLREGTLHPISLTFSSRTPVYPLRMTSLNPGRAKILLYVLAEKEAKAEGFETRYAQSVERLWTESPLIGLLERAGFTGQTAKEWYSPTACFLTKLEASLEPGEMKDDVTIEYAGGNEPYRETLSGKGVGPDPLGDARPEGMMPKTVALSLVGLIVGVVVTVLVTRRRQGRG